VETHDVLNAASGLGLPTVCLVNEFADYTRPIGKMSAAVLCAHRTIVPAAMVKDSIGRELKALHGIDEPLERIQVLTQGKLPWLPTAGGGSETREALCRRLGIPDAADTKLVVGAGAVHVRKGVDVFVSLARRIRRDGVRRFSAGEPGQLHRRRLSRRGDDGGGRR
jgi:hypothetical protein